MLLATLAACVQLLKVRDVLKPALLAWAGGLDLRGCCFLLVLVLVVVFAGVVVVVSKIVKKLEGRELKTDTQTLNLQGC